MYTVQYRKVQYNTLEYRTDFYVESEVNEVFNMRRTCTSSVSGKFLPIRELSKYVLISIFHSVVPAENNIFSNSVQ